jgi:hypothetical protein
MIDKLCFAHPSPNASVGPSIPVIENSRMPTKDVGVEMYSSLMGRFYFVLPIHRIYSISSRSSSSMRYVPFHTLYFNDPWTLPSLNMSCEVQSHIGMKMPLSAIEVAYRVVLNTTANLDRFPLQIDKDDLVLELDCLIHIISSTILYLHMNPS